jgi:hypothetical protein
MKLALNEKNFITIIKINMKTIKVVAHNKIKLDGKVLTRRPSSLGLSSWVVYQGQIYG